MISMGIDIGTTTISIIMLDTATGEPLGSRTTPSEAFIQTDKEYQKIQNPEKIWQITRHGIRQMAEEYGMPACIGMTGQMHGILYIDVNGKAVSPLYTWQDGSGKEVVSGGKTAAEILKENGMTAAAGYGLTTHFHHLLTGQVPDTAAKMVTISDYIAMRLCGRKDAVISPQMAASWGCYDLRKGDFCREKLSSLGVNIQLLPKVVKECESIGFADGLASCEIQNAAPVPVMVSLGDNQASYIGAVRDKKDAVLVNVGTGAQVSFICDADTCTDLEGSIELRPFAEGKYLMAGASLCGGRAYAMLQQFYMDIFRTVARDKESCSETQIYQLMEKQAREFKESKGMEDAWRIQPTFAGTRNDPLEKGSITGISVENFCGGALTLGMMEGMIRELHDMYLTMIDKTGVEAGTLVGSGNAIRRNPLLREITEEIFGMKMTVPDCEEEAAYGAAMMASVIRCCKV